MKLIYPCDSKRITSKYGKRNLGDGFHDGLDFGGLKAGVDGDKIYAAHDGVVGRSYVSTSYGECVVINSKEGFSTIYAHLQKRTVRDGDVVKAGSVIGHMGSTGNSTATHLHFELKTKTYTAAGATEYYAKNNGKSILSIDPMPFIVSNDKPETKVENKGVTPLDKKTIVVDNTPSLYAKTAWEKAIAKKITDGTLPKEPVTREQVAVMLERLGLL